jgi:putative selenate reductase molybdopterin-binding subunit
LRIRLILNGKREVFDVTPNETLMQLLRLKGFESVRHGCETADCGSCAVLVDGVPVNSCIMLAAQAEDRRVDTAEAVEGVRTLAPVQQALVDCGASQCGFCIPGILISSKALLDSRPTPDPDEVVDALSGNRCRCEHYFRPVKAIVRALTGRDLDG